MSVDSSGAAASTELIVLTPHARLHAAIPRGARGNLELLLGGLATQTCDTLRLDLAANEEGAVVRVRWSDARGEPLHAG